MKYAQLSSILLENVDPKYLLFCGPIVNAKTPLLGVRMPVLHEIAKKIMKESDSIEEIPFHQSVEMDIVLGICHMESKDTPLQKYAFLDDFLPGIDNWMVIDSLASSFSTKDYQLGLRKIKQYANSKYPFARRFAYVHFLANFVQKDKLVDLFKIMKRDDHYYVRMAMAWLLCECFVHYPDETETFLSNNTLNDWIINKSISKIHDSFRVSEEAKNRIKKYRRNRKT